MLLFEILLEKYKFSGMVLHLFKSLNSHQAFVRLTLGKQEIFYVAQADSKSRYKFELDVSGTASDFGNQSGEYTLVRTSALC